MWRQADIPYWRLSGVYFFYFALLGAWLPYWGLYLQEEGFNAAQIGTLSAIMLGTKIVAPSIWGWLGDRSGRRLGLIRWGNGLALLAFLGIFISQDFLVLVLVVTGFSFFWNAVLPQFEVVTLGFLKHRFEYYSQIRLWGSIGFIVAVAGLGLWFDHVSLQTLPVVLALLLLAILISSLLVADQPVDAAPNARGLWQTLRQPGLLAFFTVALLLQFSHGPYYTFYSIYLQQLGYDRSAIGMLWSLGVVAEVLLFMVMHQTLQRWSIRVILLLSLLLSALRWYLVGYHADSLAILLFAQLLHAASFGSFHAVAIEYVRRYFRGGHHGQGQAIYSGIGFGAGGALGALASGLLWDKSESGTFAMAAGACLLATLLAWLFLRQEPGELEAQAAANEA
jgi:PPP family 3-phenylpropionic acid transporter